jgi:hypothetical protein
MDGHYHVETPHPPPTACIGTGYMCVPIPAWNSVRGGGISKARPRALLAGLFSMSTTHPSVVSWKGHTTHLRDQETSAWQVVFQVQM